MNDKYTLITGGSEGIGFELAKLFAGDNNNLILVGRNKEKLVQAQVELESIFNVDIKLLCIDLSVDNSCEKVFEFVEKNNFIVDNLINNAGMGSFGEFINSGDGFEEKIINLNIVTLTQLTKYFMSKMILNNYGSILNIASTAAFVGGPIMAMYYSTKAFVLSLTEALHDEAKEYNVTVSCLCPGPVKTKFQEKAGITKSEVAKGYLMSPVEVAICGYNGLKKGKAIIVPGFKNKILVFCTKIIPRSISRKIIMKMNKA